MIHIFKRIGGKFSLLFFIFFSSLNSFAVEIFRFHGNIFGTTYNISVATDEELSKDTKASIIKQVNDKLKNLDTIYSTWNKDSELSKLNNYAADEWFSLSDELEKNLLESKKLSEFTDSAFDPTIGFLINTWGFGSNRNSVGNTLPNSEQVNFALGKIGFDNLEIEQGKIKKKYKEIYIDLSAIAKGASVDSISDLLSSLGYTNHLVEIGGEIRGKGNKMPELWTVAIENPIENQRSINNILRLSQDIAMATSGDYRNYKEVDNKRIMHIIDPRTGYVAEHKLASASVFAQNAMLADALATAFMVMGEEEAVDFAKKNNIAAYFIIRENADNLEFTSIYSPAAEHMFSN